MRHTLAVAALAAAVTACAGPDHKEQVSHAAIATTAQPAASCTPPPSDLQVTDLAPGKGDPVRFRTAVLVDYTGWLYDGCAPDHKGKKFDTSEGKAPISFMVGTGHVIRGWDEGLIGLKEGGKRLLVIPSDKAYGAAGRPPSIPPNSALVFEVNLDHIILQPPQ